MSDPRVIVCPDCHQKTRVRMAARGVPHCARCGRPLPWLGDVTGGDFAAAVKESPLPVLVEFWAPWCGPCRMVAPVVERLSVDLAGRIKVAKVNTDEEPALGTEFGVRGIPTLVLMDAGVEKDRVTGALPGAELRGWVESRLGVAPKPRGG